MAASAPVRSAEPTISSARPIELRGVRVHNLKNIDLDIPTGQLVVLSGVSGSGKSSLAFDTIFAEGQRRYIESFSASARQYLERIERPHADRIAHVPPTIAIRTDASNRHLGAQETVASLGEIDATLKRLFSRAGRVICPDCKIEVRAQTPVDIVQAAGSLPDGTRFQIGIAPPATNEAIDVADWRSRGFTRAIVDGRSVSLDQPTSPDVSRLDWIVVDRLVAGKASAERLTESAESALNEGQGRCAMLVEAEGDQQIKQSSGNSIDSDWVSIDDRQWKVVRFSQHWECVRCHRSFLRPEPRLFEPTKENHCEACQQTMVHDGSADCPVCRSTRLGRQALAVQLGSHNIAEFFIGSVAQAADLLAGIGRELDDATRSRAALLLNDLQSRLATIADIGLGHLTLQRSAKTLSAGSLRRLMLATAIGSRITGTLCLIDEPSAGLMENEIPVVIKMLRRLLKMRNSVIVVDHALEVVRAAEYVVDLGPGAGPQGGRVVFQGSADDLTGNAESATGLALAALPKAEIRSKRQPIEWLSLAHVSHRHLQGAEVRIPLGVLCVVAGPAGSGKTALIIETLVPALQTRLGLPVTSPVQGKCDPVEGGDSLSDVVVVDQTPLTRSSRSNAATWIDVFDEIRDVFAMTADAKQRGFGPQHFSFNAAQGGRCRACRGTGILRHNMQFLPDVTLACPECGGSRFRRDILEIKYRGRSIADVLSMSATEAAVFFRNHPRLQSKLQLLKQIGLDYLVLGQPTDTLSGGEAQRLKLAARLTKGHGPTLIVCDDATLGLHPADITRLVRCFDELLAIGHSILVIDNSPQMAAPADYVIELALSSTT